MPEGDSFNKIITVTNSSYDEIYLTSLLHNPYIYALSEEGEVLFLLDVASITGKTFEITDINWFKTEHSKVCIVVNGKTQNTVFFLQEITKESATSIEVGGKDSGKVLAVYVSVTYIEGKVLLLKDTNTWELYDETGTLLDKKHFPWPQISAIGRDQSKKDDFINIPVGFENGQICIVNWSMQDQDLVEFLPKYLLRKQIVASNMAPYGVAHYLLHHQYTSHGDDKCFPIALSCSNTHLCVFGELNKLQNLGYMRNSSKDYQKKPDEENTLKLLCRIRKKFDMAVFTHRLKFILATRGGTIDCFKIAVEKIKPTGFEAHYFATIDAHGQEISKILVMAEADVLFMTACKDSSLKYYKLIKIGATRKYIPNFDRTERDITKIFPGMATAVTCSKLSRFIHYWDIISGKIRGLFQHPLNHEFLECATTDNVDQLVAIDENGKCYGWRLQGTAKSTVGQPRLRRRTTSKLKPLSAAQNQVVIEAPDPDFQIDSGIKMDKTSDYQNVHMILLGTKLAVIAFKNNKKAYIAQISEGGKTEELNDFKGPVRYALKMKDHALLISESECAIVTTEGNRTNVFTLEALLGAMFDNISDVSYASAEDMVLFVSSNKLILWEQTGGSVKPSIELEGMNPTSAKTILTSETSVCVVMDKEAKQFCQVNLTTGMMMGIREIKKKNQPVQHAKVTPDGQYLLYVTGDKDLYLVRLSDGKLLAWYTMYDHVQSLSASADSWFVLVGTSDKRLFVLVIADPLESSHDRRIAHVRKLNPPLTQEQMVTLMGDVNDFDTDSDVSYYDMSDNDYIIEKASKKMQQTANNALGKTIKVLYSSDSSGGEDDDDMMKHQPKIRAGGSRKENLVIGAPTIPAYDGDLCTIAPCTLQ